MEPYSRIGPKYLHNYPRKFNISSKSQFFKVTENDSTISLQNEALNHTVGNICFSTQIYPTLQLDKFLNSRIGRCNRDYMISNLDTLDLDKVVISFQRFLVITCFLGNDDSNRNEGFFPNEKIHLSKLKQTSLQSLCYKITIVISRGILVAVFFLLSFRSSLYIKHINLLSIKHIANIFPIFSFNFCFYYVYIKIVIMSNQFHFIHSLFYLIMLTYSIPTLLLHKFFLHLFLERL